MTEQSKLDQVIRRRYGKACGHFHHSGRRCGMRIASKLMYCELHKTGTCEECQQMLKAFQPPKGWRI